MNLYQAFSHSSDLAANNRRLRYCPHCGAGMPQERLEKFARQQCPQCRRIHYLNPTPGVTVLVRDGNGRILIGKRSERTAYGSLWCLPGGYIEYEETFIATAHREVFEETGLAIRLDGIVNVVSNHLDDLHHTLVIVLLAELRGGTQAAGDDITELQWIDRAAHATVSYAFEADRRIIDCYFAGNMCILPIDRRFETM